MKIDKHSVSNIQRKVIIDGFKEPCETAIMKGLKMIERDIEKF